MLINCISGVLDMDLLEEFRFNLKVFLAQSLLRFEDINLDIIKTKNLIENNLISEIRFDTENAIVVRNIINTLNFFRDVPFNALEINRNLFININAMLAKEQALEVGKLRNGDVFIDCIKEPIKPPLSTDLDRCLSNLDNCYSANYRSVIPETFSKLARMQPFFDGNKRSALFICNVALIKKNLGIFFIKNELYPEFQVLLTDFYTQNSKKLFNFLEKNCIYDHKAIIELKNEYKKTSEKNCKL